MLIDCSASMNACTDGVSALERAKSAALSLAQRLGRDERLTLIRVTSKPEEIFSRFSSDAETIRSKIEGLETRPCRANLFAALKRVFEPAGHRDATPITYLFTDCQSNGWPQAEQQVLDRLIIQGARIIVVDVGSRAVISNRAVVGDVPQRQGAIVGLPVILKPRVVNYSKDETVEVTVKAFVNDQEVARDSLTLQPSEERVTELTYIPHEPGLFHGHFEIPLDRFPDDDSFLFTLSIMPQVQVILVNGNPDPQYFENETLYLRTALTSGAVGEDVEAVLQAQVKPGESVHHYKDFVRSLDVREISEPDLNPETLKSASVAILANCSKLNDQQFDWLRSFVTKGGGLIIFPGDLVNAKEYNEQFFPVPGPQKESLTGVRLGKPKGDPKRARTFERFAAIDFQHPVLAVFDNPDASYLSTVRFYRRFPLSIEQCGNAWPLARFSAGDPALVESRLGEGIVLVAAFPVSTKWSNLPLKPEFVPLLLRMVNHVQRRPDVEVASVASAEGVTEIAVAKDWAPVSGTITDSAGQSSALAFKRSDARMVAAFEQANKKGYYTVEVNGGSSDPPKSGKAVIAVNVVPEESDFLTISESELRKLMPQARVTLVDASSEAQQIHGAVGDEREIWRPMIWLVFVVIGVEFALATRSGRITVRKHERPIAKLIEWLRPKTLIGRLIESR